MHGCVIHTCRLMDVHIDPVVSLDHESSLHASRTSRSLRCVGADGRRQFCTNFREPGFCEVILLRVVIPRNPPRRMVARHRELRLFLLDDEIGEVLLVGESIAEGQSVVEQTECDAHGAVVHFLIEHSLQLIIVVTYFSLFSPHRFPCLIVRGSKRSLDFKTRIQVGPMIYWLKSRMFGIVEGFLLAFCLLLELKAQETVVDDGLSVEIEMVEGSAVGIDVETELEPAVGRVQVERLMVGVHSLSRKGNQRDGQK